MSSFSLLFQDKSSFFVHCKNLSPVIFPISELLDFILKNENGENEKPLFSKFEEDFQELITRLNEDEYSLGLFKEFHALITIYANFFPIRMNSRTIIESLIFIKNNLKKIGFQIEMEDCLFLFTKLLSDERENERINDNVFLCQKKFLNLQFKIMNAKGEKINEILMRILLKNNADFLLNMTFTLQKIEKDEGDKLFTYLRKIFQNKKSINLLENIIFLNGVLSAAEKYFEFIDEEKNNFLAVEDLYNSLFWFGEVSIMEKDRIEKCQVFFQMLLNVIIIKMFKLHSS
jgi:hypothetical protein